MAIPTGKGLLLACLLVAACGGASENGESTATSEVVAAAAPDTTSVVDPSTTTSFPDVSTTTSTPADEPQSTDVIVQIGDSGQQVASLQDGLVRYGYDIGPSGVDGQFGEDTRAAVTAFQSDYDLPITGVGDLATFNTLVGLDNSMIACLRCTPNEWLVPELVASIFVPGQPSDVAPLHSSEGLSRAFENYSATINWNGVDCEWLPVSPSSSFDLSVDVTEETERLDATACALNAPGFQSLALVIVSSTESCGSTPFWGQTVPEQPDEGYFVTSARETVRDDGSTYLFAWVGWQTPTACLAVKLVNEPSVDIGVTQSLALVYLISLEYDLVQYT